MGGSPYYIGRHTLKAVGRLCYGRYMAESLPDSGGAYFDADSGGVGGIARRWYGKGKGAVLSGDPAATAIGFAAGTGLFMAAKYVNREL